MLPEGASPAPLATIERHLPGLLALMLLVAMPLVLLALTPWLEQRPRQERGGTPAPAQDRSRWNPRTGVMGSPR
jgi:hypothetical protein